MRDDEKDPEEVLVEEALIELNLHDVRFVKTLPDPLQTDRLAYYFKHRHRDISFSFMPDGSL